MTNQQEADELIETKLRVLTWNIWWRYGPWEERRAAIADTLDQLGCDIICLQEVWEDGKTNFAAELAGELGYSHVFASSMERDDLGFGNAILSRWPIIRSETFQLSGAEENGESRVALFAQIDGPRGGVPVFCTHLNWKFHDSHIRQCQVRDLAQFIDKQGAIAFPPVVCGDFNADPESEELRMLKGLTACPVEGLVFHDSWTVAGNSGPGYTWDNDNPYVAQVLEPNRRIDYVLVAPPKERGAGHITDCKVVARSPVDDIYPSDHYGVLAQLRY